jgi:thioester reductase-like protein
MAVAHHTVIDMNKSCRRVLVTGARGLVGAEVIVRLLATGCRVVGFMRSDGPVLRNDGNTVPASVFDGDYPSPGQLATVSGDVGESWLGLSRETYDALRATTDLIVHCAAITSFGRRPEKYMRVNFQGTCRMLDFARPDAGVPIPLVYISTAYVCGERPGVFRESDLDLGQSLGNPYEQSKFQAEQAVRAAIGKGLPAVVLRPSIIVGDSKSGVIRKFDTLYTVLRVTSAGLVRTMSGDYGATLDIVPIDWVTDSIVQVLGRLPEALGRTLHLTSGVPLSLREVNDVSAEFPSFHVPRYVPRHVFDATRLEGLERRYYEEVVCLYESYLSRQVRFAIDSTSEIVTERPRLAGKALLKKILTYAVTSGYLVPPSTSDR